MPSQHMQVSNTANIINDCFGEKRKEEGLKLGDFGTKEAKRNEQEKHDSPIKVCAAEWHCQ